MNERTNKKTVRKDELKANLDFINTHWDIQSTPTIIDNKISLKQGLLFKFQNLFYSRFIRHIDLIADQQAIFNSFVSQALTQFNDQIAQNNENVSQTLTPFNDQITQTDEKVSQTLTQFNDQIAQTDEKVSQTLTLFNDQIAQTDEKVSQALTQFNDQIAQTDEKVSRETKNLSDRIITIENELIGEKNQLSQDVQSFKDRWSEAITTLQHRTLAVEITEQANLDNLCQRIREVDSQINSLIRSINEIDSALKPRISMNLAGMPIPKKDRFNYLEFEEVFRGSEDLIKERQRQYIPYFKGRKKVIDLGSGRGEFLVLLNEEGIQGIGVDCDQDMILRSREKGLNVIQQDILEYLEEVPDKSLDGIFSAQVVEHLPFEKLDLFFKRSYAKLENDGILIVETVNPYNFSAFRCFYMDPTHQKPLFPELISYMCRASGFDTIEVKFIPTDLHTQHTNISDPDDQWTCGDYAVIAKKIKDHI